MPAPVLPPSTLFVAKTATIEEGNWAGFWDTDVAMQHFHELYQCNFHTEPNYSKEKIVAPSADVAEIYVPLHLSVAYAGQTPVRKPFLMIVEWVRTSEGWKMATDPALPIPQNEVKVNGAPNKDQRQEKDNSQ